ncbi:hypothetical protein EON83_17655 [bacterium]|nr:MAG: hypothetical protein EON83_17655 [bacterium]
MSIGSLLYHTRVKFKHGLRTAYYRDVVRPRILQTRPVTDTSDLSCEIHVLTSASDWLNLLWALKSFYHYSKRHYALCIHDDGSLTDDIRATLLKHFPQARLVKRADADQHAYERLENYPRSLEFRKKNLLAPKIFDFPAEAKSKRMLLLDSDVLFFAEPTTLLERIEDPNYQLNTVNRDAKEASLVDPKTVKQQTGVNCVECFNSGLGLIFIDSLRLDWIEEFLKIPNINEHFWRIEQTLYMLCSARFGCEILPESYNVHLTPGSLYQSRHYVGSIRHLMYSEGIKRLVRDNFLSLK